MLDEIIAWWCVEVVWRKETRRQMVIWGGRLTVVRLSKTGIGPGDQQADQLRNPDNRGANPALVSARPWPDIRSRHPKNTKIANDVDEHRNASYLLLTTRRWVVWALWGSSYMLCKTSNKSSTPHKNQKIWRKQYSTVAEADLAWIRPSEGSGTVAVSYRLLRRYQKNDFVACRLGDQPLLL